MHCVAEGFFWKKIFDNMLFQVEGKSFLVATSVARGAMAQWLISLTTIRTANIRFKS